MSTNYSPEIVTDSLLLCIDANGSGTKEFAKGRTITPNGISVGDYTPSSAGRTAKAFVFPSGGTARPTLAYTSDWDVRGNMSWDFVACKETDANRQAVWSQIEDAGPWEGLGNVSMSHDSNGELAIWGGNYDISTAYGWWDTGITLATDKWYYCAGTWESTAEKQIVYARTVGDSSFTMASTTSYGPHTGGSSNDVLELGDNGTGGGATHIIDGGVAFVRIYTRVLSYEEILQNFNAQRTRFGL
jgi:hypothetical protein